MQAQQLHAPADTNQLAGKYLTFRLGKETYGLEILKVREIIGLMEITLVPRTPTHIRGVINLRGKIIPVVDLRLKFAMQRAADTEQTCIIVVDFHTDEGVCQMGVLVDAVSEVLDITAQHIEPAPSFGTDVDAGFIRAMAKTNGAVAILLNVENILDNHDLAEIASTAEHADSAD